MPEPDTTSTAGKDAQAVIGEELSSTVPVVEAVAFPDRWMVRKRIAAATPLPPLLPLAAGSEHLAPPWLAEYHRKGHAQISYDVGCYFARNAVVAGIGNLVVDDTLIVSPEFMPDYWHQAVAENEYAGLRRELGLPRRVIDDKVVVAGGWGTKVYGHMLIEMLPRLWVAQQALGEDWPSYKVLLSTDAPRWLTDILTRWLGIVPQRLVRYDPAKETVCATHAALPSLVSFNTHFHPAFNSFVSDTIAKTCQHNRLALSRLYVARFGFRNPSSPYRRCLNEERLAEIAAGEFGFTVLRPETLLWPLQIELFRNAQVVVGEFGSGMHNTIFSNEGVHVGCIGVNNLTQTYIGALRKQTNVYLAVDARENGAFEVDEEKFRVFLAAATAGASR